jgi:hypothetical protein
VTTTDVEEPRRTRVPVQDSPAPDVVPFGWETGPADAPEPIDGEEVYFRFPGVDDPAPGTRRLLAMSIYASFLGLAGVGVGIRGLVSQIGGGVPGWYVPVLAFLGMVSVAFSVGAFLSIHRRVLPWLLLLGAAVPLIADVMLAVAY